MCVSIRETHQTQSALPTSSARARSHSSLTLTTSSWAVRSSPPPHAHSVPVSRHHRHRTTPHAFACRAHLLYRPCCYGDDSTRSGSAFAELRARVSKSRRGVGKVGGGGSTLPTSRLPLNTQTFARALTVRGSGVL